MHSFIKKRMKRGISYIDIKHIKANKKYMQPCDK